MYVHPVSAVVILMALFVTVALAGLAMIISKPTKEESASPIRFRLRDLFIATTIVAVILGAWAWYGNELGKAQRDAREEAIRAGRLPPE